MVDPVAALVDRHGAVFGLAILAICLLLLCISSFVNMPMWLIAVCTAGLFLLHNVIRYPWQHHPGQIGSAEASTSGSGSGSASNGNTASNTPVIAESVAAIAAAITTSVPSRGVSLSPPPRPIAPSMKDDTNEGTNGVRIHFDNSDDMETSRPSSIITPTTHTRIRTVSIPPRSDEAHVAVSITTSTNSDETNTYGTTSIVDRNLTTPPRLRRPPSVTTPQHLQPQQQQPSTPSRRMTRIADERSPLKATRPGSEPNGFGDQSTEDKRNSNKKDNDENTNGGDADSDGIDRVSPPLTTTTTTSTGTPNQQHQQVLSIGGAVVPTIKLALVTMPWGLAPFLIAMFALVDQLRIGGMFI
jgi:hypothetical protein